eukprot:Partr_v1_DN28118_c1_g1_i3_m55331 putative Transcription factor
MNSIFSAQKLSIPISVFRLGPEPPSIFLRQAAHLTNGAYIEIHEPGDLLQNLLTLLPVDAELDSIMAETNVTDVNFQAACFCHRRIVDTGFVCSVCLSIYCNRADQCSTCGTVMAASSVAR